MATEALSIRIPTDLMAQMRTEMANSQATLTATVVRLLTAGMAAEAATAMLNRRLEAAVAEISRLQAAVNSTSSAVSMAAKADTGSSVATGARRNAEPRSETRDTSRHAHVNALAADRLSTALRGAGVGGTLFMFALVPMPHDWWFPQLVAKVSMGGGSDFESGARLAGFESGIDMLTYACPRLTLAVEEHEARILEAKKQRQSAKSGAAKRKAGRSTAKGPR